MTEKNYPKLNNLGKDCRFWKRKISTLDHDEQQTGCIYPKAEVIGRTSCEGIIDDVCLYLITGRKPKSLTEEQRKNLKLSPPSLTNEFLIPPGDTIA